MVMRIKLLSSALFVLLAIVALFPPWNGKVLNPNGHVQSKWSNGSAFIGKPPRYPVAETLEEQIQRLSSSPPIPAGIDAHRVQYEIDWDRFILEVAAVLCAIAIAAVWIAPTRAFQGMERDSEGHGN